MFDFSDVVPVLAYLCVLLILSIVFAATGYAAYRGGKRKRRRSRYRYQVEDVGDSYFLDAAAALGIILFPIWMIHGLSVIRSASSNESSYVMSTSLWGVAAYWAVAWMVGFACVRLLRREIPAPPAVSFVACLISILWFVEGFQPLNDWFLRFSGG